MIAPEIAVKQAQMGYQVRVECPECGSEGPHDTNADRQDPTFCCAACGMHCSIEEE